MPIFRLWSAPKVKIESHVQEQPGTTNKIQTRALSRPRQADKTKVAEGILAMRGSTLPCWIKHGLSVSS